MAYSTKEKERAHSKAYCDANRDRINKANRERYRKNAERYAAEKRAYRSAFPEKAREASERYLAKNRAAINVRAKERHRKNKDKDNAYARQYRANNLEAMRERVRAYHLEHREEIYRKRREKRAANLEATKAYEREQYRKHVVKKLAHSKRYRKANHDKKLASVRKYNAAHPEIRKAIERRYRAKHPEIAVAVKANRRAFHMNAEGRHTPADILAIWERQGHKCAVPNCQHPISAQKGKDKYHVDHILALKLGGSNWPSNLQILCRHHNVSKCALSPEKWAARLAAACPVPG